MSLLHVLLSLVGCGPGGGWTQVAALPSDYTVERVVVPRGGEPVLLGRADDGPSGSLHARRVAIYRMRGGSPRPVHGGEEGWIAAADGREDEIWAVRARKKLTEDGSTYALLRSEDAGATWVEAGPVPAGSVTAVTIEGSGAGWVLGAGNLLRTEDAGASWRAVEAPGQRRGIAEPLATLGPGQAVLGGPRLRRTDDGGASWRDVAAEEILATDGSFVVGRDGAGLRVGRLDRDGIAWVGRHDGELQPDQVVHGGGRVMVRAAPLGRRAGRNVIILESTDGGATFVERKTYGGSRTATVELLPDGSAWHLDVRRRLRKYSPAR